MNRFFIPLIVIFQRELVAVLSPPTTILDYSVGDLMKGNDMFKFTIFERVEGEKPSAKIYKVGMDGKLTKSEDRPYGIEYGFTYQCPDMKTFAKRLSTVKLNRYFCYGIHNDELEFFNSGAKDDTRVNTLPDFYARTLENFHYQDYEPGILTLDFDDLKDFGMDGNDILSLLYQLFPFLEQYNMVAQPSSSANVVHTASGKVMVPTTGMHFYILLDDASDIPRVGNVIFERMILAGYGKPKIQGNKINVLTLIDKKIYQANRQDYVAGAVMPEGYHQERPAIFIEGEKGDEVPSDLFQSLSKIERLKLNSVKDKLIAKLQPELDAINDEKIASASSDIERKRMTDAIKNNILRPGTLLRTKSGAVDVADILDNPHAYTKRTDFLDPDTGASGKAKILHDSKGTVLHCFGKGGRVYRLLPELSNSYYKKTGKVVKSTQSYIIR